MGFFFSDPTYSVVKVGGWFTDDQAVVEGVTMEEAQDYVDSRSGWFGDDGNTYKIVKDSQW
ncbi:hypothetical protein Uis1B_0351 [Bifidobacterium margollesii]|uniref:Uncharacterized protein n=1 Tax=Bifidobacterium margollesii TaxID=2020964 RepID=A0A2N5JC64_9BIFI|nr:hypothetical protein [Bifidobacterium margollesii]PLS31813.1 hypothetical protein Uis1B_0351 [Bifidobacterium margollesii]